jgi:hypothetical protein
MQTMDWYSVAVASKKGKPLKGGASSAFGGVPSGDSVLKIRKERLESIGVETSARGLRLRFS